MFISIEIGPLQSLIDIGENLKKINPDIKIVNPKNIHFTLKFLGDTEVEKISTINEIIKLSLEDISPFSLNLKGLGVFPSLSYMRIIWVGLEATNAKKNILYAISNKIDTELAKYGFSKNKKFKPHATIARIKRVTDKISLEQFLNKYSEHYFDTKNIGSIALKKSTLTPQGPIYETLTSIKI